MPAWSDVTRGDDEGLRAVEARTREFVAGHELDDILAAERAVEARDEYDVGSMSRLYVLNRLLFAVPEVVPSDAPGFAAFVGVPSDGETIGELWPWSLDDSGSLRLTGYFAGYVGEAYQASAEAESFRDRFGPR